MVSVNSTMLPLGSTAPDFALSDPAGNLQSLGSLVGSRGTLVAFVSNHCPYVKHIGSHLGKLADSWNQLGVTVVAINSNAATHPDDQAELMPSAAAAWGWNFPYLVDETQSAARLYQAACTPDFYLFDRNMALVYRGRFDGSTPRNEIPVTGNELDTAVRQLVAGESIPTDQQPSIGCNIKWTPDNQPSWFITT